MFSCNSIYRLPCDGAFSAHINGSCDTFPGTTLISKKINWVEQARKPPFSTMPSPNIPGLAIVLNKTFPSPTVEQVLSSHRYTEAYITVKDHKEGFPCKLSFRSINPSKSDTGKISKDLLDKINLDGQYQCKPMEKHQNCY